MSKAALLIMDILWIFRTDLSKAPSEEAPTGIALGRGVRRGGVQRFFPTHVVPGFTWI